ncbi:hypothetical protein DXG01_011505 [Tephrocybe rancida]|nr:hypothetical protein DXG01_011505 [Tephrocybe rancida]
MIYQRDTSGATPLDLALRVNNRHAVEIISQLDLERRTSSANQLETKLVEILRLIKIQNDGYPKEELTLEFKSNRVQGMPDNLADYIEQRKWGCTCGKCTLGWLSPQMRYRLAFASDTLVDITMPDGSRMPVTTAAQKTLYRRGYKYVFATIRTLLEAFDSPFTMEAINELVEGKPGVDFYLRNGGSVQDVLHPLTSLLSKIMTDQHIRQDFEDDIFAKENETNVYAGLPSCTNDLNFSLVRRRLGLPPIPRNDENGFRGLLSAASRIKFVEELLNLDRAGEL